MRCCYNFRTRLYMILVEKIYHFLIKSYDYSMEALYPKIDPKIVNACTKFAQNYVYYEYKCNFSVLPRNHTTLFAKKRTACVQCTMYCNTLPNQLGHTREYGCRAFFAEWCAFIVWFWNEFGISASLFWHTDVHTKFA